MNEHALRGFSYNGAFYAGMEPNSYTWQSVPVGNWAARLDFKTWSNTSSSGHLVCYCTSQNDGQRYCLSAFRPVNGSRRYAPKDGVIDFSVKDLEGGLSMLSVGTTGKGTPSWRGAERIATDAGSSSTE
ncbi:hypothetical protein QZQ41_01750 [Serratia marcescens]|nr:hypothetical protein [Serratia marcescens]MDP8612957.1 hypothetical protein [Serratia marcescens]MDP8613351.1 hypothetical protein [Serratia marcescens]MDP8643405.1 hypothetical protein [Serratia marcescens]MDP8653340.1 hypothetical protein [Serratia marcescens]MDP8658303.1 hypothetical protein [Serratia marcescens]